MKKMTAVLLAFLCLCPFSPSARAELADGVAAAIDYKVISLSILRAYQQALDPQASLAKALSDLISDRLLSAEALRYGQSVSVQDVAAAAAPLSAPAGLTEAEWHSLVGDQLLARRFLSFRFGGFVPVTSEQLQSYYQAHRARFPQTFAKESQAIRDLLTPQLRRQQEASYIQDLRTRANVRLNQELLNP